MKEYHYFVAYVHREGYGNSEMTRSTPIQNISDIFEVQQRIVDDVFKKDGNIITGVCVTNFQLFDKA